LLAAAAVDPMEIARRARHSSVAFTYDRYGHLFPEADSMAAAKLEAIRAIGLSRELGELTSFDRLVRHRGGLSAGEEPADDCRESRHSEKDKEEVCHGDVPKRGNPAVQRVAPQPTDHADVSADHPE